MDRRPRGDSSGARAAQDFDGVPVLRAVSTFERAGEHRLRAAGTQDRARRPRPAPEARLGASGIIGTARSKTRSALRRPTTESRAWSRADRRSAGVPDGRAFVEPRRAIAAGNASRDSPPAAAASRHPGFRYAL